MSLGRAINRPLILLLAAAVIVAGCTRRENPELLQLKNSGEGPDEFAIVPTKPLVIPEDLAALPAPVTGGQSRGDATPRADAYAALGGDAAVVTSGARSSEAGLLAYTGRYGRSPNIRRELAASDLDLRRRNDALFLERIAGYSKYFEVYAPQSLDQHAELERWRRAGAATPAAPPPPLGGQ